MCQKAVGSDDFNAIFFLVLGDHALDAAEVNSRENEVTVQLA